MPASELNAKTLLDKNKDRDRDNKGNQIINRDYEMFNADESPNGQIQIHAETNLQTVYNSNNGADRDQGFFAQNSTAFYFLLIINSKQSRDHFHMLSDLSNGFSMNAWSR